MAAAGVHPEQILRELRELWTTLAQDQAEAGGVLRACAMTLLVTAGDAADADQVRKTLGVLMHSHPSRAIVIRQRTGDDGGMGADADLTARVFAECWMPFGRNQQICSEGIEITPGNGTGSGAGGMSEVARFLVPLRAPDLPLVLWRRGESGPSKALGEGALGEGALGDGALGDEPYDSLLPLADKIIFDTRNAPDALGALRYLRDLRAHGRVIADLHWTRLSGWREVVAHLFDDRAMPPASVKSAVVRYGGGRLTTCALYFAAWIRSSLPQASVAIDSVDGPACVVEIQFKSAAGQHAVKRVEAGVVEVTGSGRNYRSTLPPASEEDLMREELGILGRDAAYEKALSA